MEGSVKGLLEGLVTGLMIKMKVRGLSESMRMIGKGRRPATKQLDVFVPTERRKEKWCAVIHARDGPTLVVWE